MFAFGILVSPLPYAVVFVLYAFYLIVVQFNDSYDSQLSELEQDEKQIILEEDAGSSFQQSVYIIAASEEDDDNIKDTKTTGFNNSIAHRSVGYFDLHLLPERSDKPFISEFNYALYSRPPPLTV